MILTKEQIVKFLETKFSGQKVLLIFRDDKKDQSFIEEVCKNCVVVLEKQKARCESVRCVVSFGEQIEKTQKTIYFCKNFKEFLVDDSLLCLDFFDFDKKSFLCIFAYLIEQIYIEICNKIFENKSAGNFDFLCFETFLQSGKKECIDFLEKHKKYFKNAKCHFCFDEIINAILTYKLGIAFLKEKPFVKIFSAKNFANKNNYFTANLKNFDVQKGRYIVCENYKKFLKLTLNFGVVICKIFNEYKAMCDDYGFCDLQKIQSEVFVKKFFQNFLKSDFCFAKIMENLGLI